MGVDTKTLNKHKIYPLMTVQANAQVCKLSTFTIKIQKFEVVLVKFPDHAIIHVVHAMIPLFFSDNFILF